MLKMMLAFSVGVLAGVCDLSLLAAGALAEARAATEVQARLVRRFVAAYEDGKLLAIMGVYHDAKRKEKN